MTERLFIKAALIGVVISLAGAAYAQPSVVTGGVLNAASFAKNAAGQGTPVSPGALVSIFGTNLGSSQADASTIPFSTALGGVSVTFGGKDAAIRDVIPAANLLNVQIPFDVLPAGQTSGTVNVVVSFNGQQSSPQPVQIVPQSPGLFTFPTGVGNVILVNLTDDGHQLALAAPANSIPGLATFPIARGNVAYLYATGLGIMTPPVPTGAGSNGPRNDTLTLPKVTIGGVDANVLFSGASGFPGVNQVNLQIPQNAPTGDGIVVRIAASDGSNPSPDKVSTISIR